MSKSKQRIKLKDRLLLLKVMQLATNLGQMGGFAVVLYSIFAVPNFGFSAVGFALGIGLVFVSFNWGRKYADEMRSVVTELARLERKGD